MQPTELQYRNYVQVLREELVPAMGCTEPIAVAYGAAKAREALGKLPDKVLVEASGNIIKNVKSVVVPNTGGLHGIEASAAAGIVAGKADLVLEVISQVTEEEKEAIRAFMADHEIKVRPAESDIVFDIILTLWAGEDHVKLRISDFHTNIVYIEKNGEVLLESGHSCAETPTESMTDRSFMSVEGILEFVETMNVDDVREMVERQINYNYAIAEEGIRGDWGANIGSVLLKHNGGDVATRARAMAAAGSDARMSGCELPVIIASGSGNQGITASVPVIVYARHLGVSDEKLYRALVVSNLSTLHIKEGIGRLSAYCGAVGAGSGAGAGIAYLMGGDFTTLAHTLVNSLAIISGTICDGAKASCAAKIASAVDAGILGYYMYQNGQEFLGGDGIVKRGVENTIRCVGLLASVGMQETDKEIVKLMIQNNFMA